MATCLMVWLFLLVSAASSDAFKLTKESPEMQLHHKMTKREMRHYFGVDSHEEVPDYDITIPHQGDPHSGEFSTFKLSEHARHRRSAEPNVWFYNIQALGVNMKLNLSKPSSVIGPKVQVETIHTNGSQSYSLHPRTSVLEGHVTSKPGSFAIIDNDNGLTGMINLLDQVLFVHPLPTHLAKDYGQQNGGGDPHVVYRHQSATKKFCHNEEPERSHHRSRRSVDENAPSRRSVDENAPSSANKILEMAIIADKFLLENKKELSEKEIIRYLQTVANILERLFQDPSVGERKLHIEVVKIVLDRKNDLNILEGDGANTRLAKLADWGVKNIEKSNGEEGHADVLVHITAGINGGLALKSSTCRYHFGRTVNNDVGLATALIAAHEIAHSMGVGHDGDPGCPDYKTIMATTLSSGKDALTWSKCSKEQIQNFLRSEESSCLNNEPPSIPSDVSNDDNPLIRTLSAHFNKLPGQLFDGDAQCQLQYDKSYTRCPHGKDSCASLTCTMNGGRVCHGRNTPPMDGTRCGERHWCIKGECVDDGSPMIDGEWGKWSDFTTCTRTCGGGLRWRSRTCSNPKPQGGGADCEGSNIGHYDICNIKDCPTGTKTFRESQCHAKLPGSRVFWKPDPCTLSCIKGGLMYTYGKVADGTRCSADPKQKHVCAQGRCLSVGCDYVLNSRVKYDHCGICGGDSSSCTHQHGSYTKNWWGRGPNRGDNMVTVPAGSTHIKASMLQLTYHMLGVKDGNRYVYPVGYTWSTTVKAAGSKVVYDHENDLYKDKIDIPGPITKPLKLVYVGLRGKNPGVKYEFFVKKKSVVTSDQVYWNTSSWSMCTQKCAQGIETRNVECLRKDDNSWVSDKLCVRKSVKPETQRKCNDQPCAPSWYQSSWRPCSRTCGRGQQIREVVCRAKIGPGVHKIVPDEKCNANKKPKGIFERDCNKINCHPDWEAGNWSQCSTTCGPNGVATRHLKCKQLKANGEHVSVPKRFCKRTPELKTTTSCNNDVECRKTFTAPNGKKFVPVGCFKEGKFQGGERALPEMVANLRGKINWHQMTKTVLDCSQAVARKSNKYKVFGVQFYGECWSGPDGEKTYAEYGWSKDCWNGVGGSAVNFIYTFI